MIPIAPFGLQGDGFRPSHIRCDHCETRRLAGNLAGERVSGRARPRIKIAVRVSDDFAPHFRD